MSNVKHPEVALSQYVNAGPIKEIEWRSSQAAVKFAEELEGVLDEFMVRSLQFSIGAILIEGLSFQWVMRKRSKQVAVKRCVSTCGLIGLVLKMSSDGNLATYAN